MAEIPFEYLLAAIEATRGTPEANPLRYLNMTGMVTPRKSVYRPEEARGLLAEHYRSEVVRRWCEWEAEGPLDVYTAPLIFNTIAAGGIDGSGAVAAEATIDPGVANTSLDYTAVVAGSLGNQISVQYVDPGAASSPLDVDVVERAVVVYLETDGAGDIATLASEIIAALAAHPVAAGMVTAANTLGHDGSGVVTAMPATYLSGGVGVNVETPGGATDSRLWTFAPTLDADDLEAMTLWWGDPNIQAFRAAFCMPDELTIAADAAGEDGVTLALSGQGLFPSKTAPGLVPAMLQAPLLMPTAMQLWIDSGGDAIGTTPVTGRLLSAELTVPSGITRKWLAQGPGGSLGFEQIGRGKRHAELSLALEVPDLDQYDEWVDHTTLKTRVRWNGPLIEAGFYFYVQADIYGPLEGLEWGENEGSNRTIELTVLSEYDDTAGYDWALYVQSDRDAL